MDTLTPIEISSQISLFVFLVFGYFAFRGRVELFMGMNLVLDQWTRGLFFFGVLPYVYIMGPFMLLAGGIAYLQRGGINFTGLRHRWIILSVLLWWAWQLFLFIVFRNFSYDFMFFVSNILIAVPLVLIFSIDLKCVRAFAVAYLATTVLGGFLLVNDVLDGRPLWYLLLNASSFRNITYNNHFLATPFVISMVLAWMLAEEAQIMWKRVVFSCSVIFCVILVTFIASRQNIVGAAFALVIIALKSLWGKNNIKKRLVAFLSVIILFIITWQIYEAIPSSILRAGAGEATLVDAASKLGNRPVIWENDWEVFLASPIWGTGFQHHPHNLFLGALTDQGLVGLFFLGVWLVFTMLIALDMFRRPCSEQFARWQQGMLLIALVAIVTGQASGNTNSLWHLFWAVVISWSLQRHFNEIRVFCREPELLKLRVEVGQH